MPALAGGLMRLLNTRGETTNARETGPFYERALWGRPAVPFYGICGAGTADSEPFPGLGRPQLPGSGSSGALLLADVFKKFPETL